MDKSDNNRFSALSSQPQQGKGGARRRNRKKNGGNSQQGQQLKSPKFTGQDKGSLEGIVISETHSTPPAQQFDRFYNAVLVYGGGINPQVKTSLKNLANISEQSMEPPLPDFTNYIGDDGKPDKAIEAALMTVWTAKATRASKLHSKYEQDLKSLFSVIWGQLNIGIKDNLKGVAKWEQIDDDNDTIELLKKLRELCYKDNNHKIAPQVDLLRKTVKAVTTKQDINKSVSMYVEEAKIKYDVLKSIGGTINSKGLVEYTINKVFKDNTAYTVKAYASAGPNDTIRKAINRAASDIMVAAIIIEGCNDKLHRNLRTTLEDQFIRNHDDYPTSPTEAAELLTQYRTKQKQSNPRESRPTTPAEPSTNNRADESTKKNDDAAQFVNRAADADKTENNNVDEQLHIMKDGDEDAPDFCFCTVGSETSGHYNNRLKCATNKYMNAPIAEDSDPIWRFNTKQTHINKARRYMNEKSSTPLMAITNMNNAFSFTQANSGIINRNWILLDSQATCNVICNKNLVTNIREHPDGRQLTIHCNAGQAVVTHIADLRGFGTVWFHPTGIANCLSLGKVSDEYRVTIDTAVTQAFFVHKTDGSTRRFDRMNCNLYACDVTRTDGALLAIITVDGQKKRYSDLDVRRATAAKKMQDTIGYPSNKEFMKMIDNNLIVNCAVTRRDVIIARDVFGPNIDMIKGKTVRQQPGHVREDISPVPAYILKSYGNVIISIDIFHVNGIKFFRSISRHIHFRLTTSIRDAKKATLMNCITKVSALYATRGFSVKQIHGDNEFQCIATEMADKHGITFHPVARGSHEPFIERDNRTSKERCRCTFNALPFDRIPARMTIEMVVGIDFWLNSWCSKGGVSKTIPPRQIVTGMKLDASMHCKFQFGDYVLAHNESDNTMKARANDAIYLRPTGSAAGGFYVFDLLTSRRVHRRSATAAHMTNNIINTVHRIAKNEGSPIGLTFGDFTNKSTILDIDVDHEPDDDDASDQSYDPNADDISVETDLTDTTSVSSEYSVELPPGTTYVHETDGYEVDDEGDANDGTDHTDNNQEVHDPAVDESEEVHHPEIEELTLDTYNGTNEGDQPTDETDAEDPDRNDGVPLTPSSIERKSRRLQFLSPLQPNTADIHPELREHNKPPANAVVLFTRGYSTAIAKLEREHTGFVLVASAIEQYNNLEASKVTPQYHINKGLKVFGEDGVDAVIKELKQLHNLNVIAPCKPSDMSREEVKRALPYLMFLKRKRSGKIKGRGCADGRSQREFISKDEASSPTVNLHALFLTCIQDSLEGRDVATVDIPGAFLQTVMPPHEDPVHIKLTGRMARMLCDIDPKRYGPCIIRTKTGTPVLYTKANKAIYGTLKAALLFWKKLSSELKKWGFIANPYDKCTVNKMIDGKQATIVWHVDDLKISHADPEVVTSIIRDIANEFGKTAPLTIRRNQIHEYLGMTITYVTKEGKVMFTMYDYLEDIIANLPENLQTNRSFVSPAADHLFTVDDSADKINETDAGVFHHHVAKLLFASKRARPDLQTGVAFLCTRVKGPDVDDWKKLIRLLGYLKDTLFLPLILGCDGTGTMYWYVDASFAVHHNMRSHTGGMMTFGTGAAISMSTKQKINTKSSTEAELVGVDDSLPYNIWCLYFLREQGYQANQRNNKTNNNEGLKFLGHRNILYQDNTSSIKLESNGKASSTKRTRHINIRYFMITDRIKKKEIEVEYCPTGDMLADYFTKPLQGSLFRRMRNAIMGISDAEYLKYKQSYDTMKRDQRSASE
jgi:hypothetical protein